MKRLCPECGEITEWEETTKKEDFNIKGEIIQINATFLRCPRCNSEYEDLNFPFDPNVLAYDEYRRRKGMVFPSQIVAYRKKYDLTQKELSVLLGFGDITLSRYENGALQDEAHDQLLKFVLDPLNLLKLIKQKPDILNPEKREQLIRKLESEKTVVYILNEIVKTSSPNILTGNREFNFPKLVNLVKFYTYQNPVFKSKLMKLLFYADFKSFKEVDYSITGLKYAHLPFGPVPDKYSFLLDSILEIDQAISIDIQPVDDPIGEVVISTEPNSTEVFNTIEDSIMRQVHNKFYGFTAKQIEDFSHEERAYKDTKNGEIISYAYAKDLNI